MHHITIKTLVLLWAVVGIFIVPVNAQDSTSKSNVAVMNLRAEGPLSDATSILSDRLRNELFNTGRYLVMERGEMDNILKEQGFQQSGACDDKACMVEAGQLLGVDKIIAGSIGQIGTKYLINLRIIDVRTGKMMDTYSGECTCPMEDLAGAMKTAAERLGNKNPISVDRKPDVERKVSKHTIGISGNTRNLSSNINSFFTLMESKDYQIIKCFIKPVDSGSSIEFGQGVGGSIIYTYHLKEKLHIKINAATYRQKIMARYDIVRKIGLPQNAGNMTVSSDLILSPFKIGATWTFLDRKNIQIRADAALAFTSLVYTIDFDGIYKTNVIQGDSIGSWLDMSAGTLGFSAGLEFIYKINRRFNLGFDIVFERVNFAKLSGTGNMEAVKIVVDDTQVRLPIDQNTGDKYVMTTTKTLDGAEWADFKKSPVDELAVGMSATKFGISLYYNFLSSAKK
ncbi:MAG: hypothetical protein JNL74_06600 [Fibrobacteres bacterium]|nr:hypothetical protein [Fibrobacterota bacterium]